MLQKFQSTGANVDFFLSAKPYFKNRKGTGMAATATSSRIDIAGLTPRLWDIGLAAKGSPAAILRKKVLAETALTAYRLYVSTRKLIYCRKIKLKPPPMKLVAAVGIAQWNFGSADQPNQNKPIGKRKLPTVMGGNLASGIGLPFAASAILR